MKRLIWLCVALLFVAAGLVLGRVGWKWLHPDPLNLAIFSPSFRIARSVYPYSIVPGGVYNGRELADSMQRDPVARSHYQGIRPERMWNSRLRAPMLAYVSYRKGDNVRWTKLVVPKGEMVLTDGTNLVRARCGNRIKKATGTAASPGESRIALNVPENQPGDSRKIPAPLAEASAEAPPEFVFETPLPALMPPTSYSTPATSVRATAAPRAVEPRAWATPVWCCSETGQQSGDTPAPPVPSPVPEPGTIVLFSSGAAAMFAAYKRRKRR